MTLAIFGLFAVATLLWSVLELLIFISSVGAVSARYSGMLASVVGVNPGPEGALENALNGEDGLVDFLISSLAAFGFSCGWKGECCFVAADKETDSRGSRPRKDEEAFDDGFEDVVNGSLVGGLGLA